MRYINLCFWVAVLSITVSFTNAIAETAVRQQVKENIRQLVEQNSCPQCDLAGAILFRVNLVGANLEGANLAGAQLNLANLAGANLRDANLQGASFGGADLAGTDLTGANLTGAIIEGAYLVGAKMDGEVAVQRPYAEEGGPNVGETVFKEAEGVPKHLPYTNQAMVEDEKTSQQVAAPSAFSPQTEGETSVAADPVPEKSKQLNMIGDVVVAHDDTPEQTTPGPEPGEKIGKPLEENPPAEQKELVKESVKQAETTEGSAAPMMDESKLSVEKAEQVTKIDAPEDSKNKLVEKLLDENRCVACDLSGVDLSGEDFEDGDLERINLQGAVLVNTDFEGANLKGANLRGANLRDADLREADLYRADISGADLTGAKLDEALVDSLVSIGAIGLNLEGTIGNE